MRYSSSRRGGWGPALEDATGAAEVINDGAPVAAFEINVSETDEDGAPLEAVDASGEPTVDVTLPETEDALDEVEDAEEVVDKLEETSEVLENYATAIESRIRENGGLTPSEWELVQIGLSSRIKNIRALTPSKESFGYSRLSASTEALDSIKEGIKNVWEAIKKAIMGVINRVRKWWAGALSDAARLGKRAKGIRENARKKSSSLKGDDNFVKLNAKNMVGENGKPLETKYYVAAAQLYSSIASSYLIDNAGDVTDIVDKMETDAKTYIDDIKNKKTGATVEEALRKIVSIHASKQNVSPGAHGTLTVSNSDEARHGISYVKKTIKDLPGNKQLVFYEDVKLANSGEITTSSISTYYRMKDAIEFEQQETKAREIDSDIEFKILNGNEIDSICNYVEDTCNDIVKYKQNFERRERVVDKYVKRMDTLTKDIGRDEDFKKNSTLSSFVSAYVRGSSDYAKNSLSRDAKLITELLSKSRDLLAYAQRSSAMYE